MYCSGSPSHVDPVPRGGRRGRTPVRSEAPPPWRALMMWGEVAGFPPGVGSRSAEARRRRADARAPGRYGRRQLPPGRLCVRLRGIGPVRVRLAPAGGHHPGRRRCPGLAGLAPRRGHGSGHAPRRRAALHGARGAGRDPGGGLDHLLGRTPLRGPGGGLSAAAAHHHPREAREGREADAPAGESRGGAGPVPAGHTGPHLFHRGPCPAAVLGIPSLRWRGRDDLGAVLGVPRLLLRVGHRVGGPAGPALQPLHPGGDGAGGGGAEPALAPGEACRPGSQEGGSAAGGGRLRLSAEIRPPRDCGV